MDTSAAFGFRELFNHVIGDMAKAVSERNGETKQQQSARAQAGVRMIMGFLLRDVIEAMLAGHCVMFHEVMTDSVRDTLRGELDTMRRATRATIVAMDKAFGNNLARLERYQNRPSEGQRGTLDEARGEAATVAPAARPAEPEVAVRADAARTDAAPVVEAPVEAASVAVVQAPSGAAAPVRVAVQGPSIQSAPVAEGTDEIVEVPLRAVLDTLPPRLREAVAGYQPSSETIAACLANPEAMAAMEDGDPERFAIAMGIDMPSEAFLLAAKGPGSPFERPAAAAPVAAAGAPRSRG
jgi:hypothetical protein